MMNFFIDNFWIITCGAVAFYVFVSVIEKFVINRSMKKYAKDLKRIMKVLRVYNFKFVFATLIVFLW